jgi:ABC-type branched-subunit amino acid transport system ATPase component
MSALLEVDSISRRFGGLNALKDVSFSIDKDEIVGLIGPNGAGKTTCFNLVSGVMAPSAGAIRFKGHSIVDHDGFSERDGDRKCHARRVCGDAGLYVGLDLQYACRAGRLVDYP